MGRNDDKIHPSLPPEEAIPIGSRSRAYAEKLEEQPAGVLANVASNSETPKQVLDRVLLPGEVVLADFDCYFPYKILPLWKIIKYCVMTLGLFLFVLLYRSIQRWCYRMKCCTPHTLEYVRGKMAVTNKGRLICWTLEVKQHKQEQSCCGSCMGCCCKLCCPDLCAAPAKYAVQNSTRIFLVDQVREIAHYYRSRAEMCYCLCNDYACGVKISLLQFDHSEKAMNSVVQSFPASHYLETMQVNVGGILEFVMGSIETALNLSSSGTTLFLTSSTLDRMHVDNPSLVLEDLASLSARFVNVLPMKEEILQSSGNEDLSKLKYSEQMAGLRIVYDDGSINIPSKWIPLLPEERVVSVVGQVYKMTTNEWIRSILTCGKHYCRHVRHRKYARSAVVLTTQRVVVIDIYQRAGSIPLNLVAFTYIVTSYFPGKINAGYYRTSEELGYVEASVLTEGGELHFKLTEEKSTLRFLRDLQLSTLRKHNPAIDRTPTTRENIDSLPKDDKELLPLSPNEQVVEVMLGQIQYDAFCRPKDFPQKLVCFPCGWCSNEPMCSHANCGQFFPLCGQVFTCMMRPFQHTSNVVLTNSSMINIIRFGSLGLFGTGLFKKKNIYIVSWVPLGDVQGHVLDLYTYGEDTCFRRCCAKCGGPCGRCCPISSNEAHLGISVGGYSFGLEMNKKNHNFLTDDNILAMTTKLSNLEAGLHQEHMQR